jgi:AbiV family abortive infection protein
VAPKPRLAACAIAAARNAQDLLHDAEVLAGAGCRARACSLAALAVEECGKAASLTALAVIPENLRAQAPVGRMLEWHQLKQVGGLLIAVVPFDSPGVGPRLAAMPDTELAQVLSTLDAPTEEADRLKRRGIYVDMDRGGRIREPSEITETEVTSQLAQARRATGATSALLGPEMQARMANPPREGVELSLALVSVLTEAGYARTPKAATDAVRKAISTLRDRTAAKDTGSAPDQSGRSSSRRRRRRGCR